MWPLCRGRGAAAQGPRTAVLAHPERSGDRGEGVLHELLELRGEPLPGRDVEAGYGVGWVGVPVPVGVGAVRVAVRIAVTVGGGGVVAIRLARWLDPDVRVEVGERGVRVRLWEGAEACAVWLHQSPRNG